MPDNSTGVQSVTEVSDHKTQKSTSMMALLLLKKVQIENCPIFRHFTCSDITLNEKCQTARQRERERERNAKQLGREREKLLGDS